MHCDAAFAAEEDDLIFDVKSGHGDSLLRNCDVAEIFPTVLPKAQAEAKADRKKTKDNFLIEAAESMQDLEQKVAEAKRIIHKMGFSLPKKGKGKGRRGKGREEAEADSDQEVPDGGPGPVNDDDDASDSGRRFFRGGVGEASTRKERWRQKWCKWVKDRRSRGGKRGSHRTARIWHNI